jgi:hypothetical protein
VALEHTDDRDRRQVVGKLDTVTGRVLTVAGNPSDPIKRNGKPNKAHLRRIRAANARRRDA